MIYLDTETVGFNGPIVTIQYALDNGRIRVHHIWKEETKSTIQLIENLIDDDVCAFNLPFDWWHLIRMYNLLKESTNKHPDKYELQKLDREHPFNRCLRPKRALDLLLIARSGEFQITMGRRPITIRKVPVQSSTDVILHLQETLELPSILNYKIDIKKCDTPNCVDIQINFNASAKLKALVKHIWPSEDVDFDAASILPQPTSYDFAPYATNWITYVDRHINYWLNDERAIRYAWKDIDYLRRLYYYFKEPEPGDVDSELAITVAATRYIGYGIDIDKIKELQQEQLKIIKNSPCEHNSPQKVKRWLQDNLSPIQSILIKNTREDTLEKLDIAKPILGARHAEKRLDLFDKLLLAKQFYPNFKVIGARSGRMAGGSVGRGSKSINPQGIQNDEQIRSCFSLRTRYLPYLTGGDFSAFEVSIWDAEVNSTRLRNDLKSGKKIYDIFGTYVDEEKQCAYHDLKTAFLGWSYGAQLDKLARVLRLPIDRVRQGIKCLLSDYREIDEARQNVEHRFCSMSQPNGLGTAVIWTTPDSCATTMFGFRRYFTVENHICKVLFDLAENLPSSIIKLKGEIKRNRVQTIAGATRSALYAGAFQIQAANMRQANNHRIQGTGARICKELQLRLWNLQPIGIHPYVIAPFNIHDEVMVTCDTEETMAKTRDIAKETEDSYCITIPLIKLDWHTNLSNWSYK